LQFFARLKWIDGRPLVDTLEPYRQRLFTQALDSYRDDGVPTYNLVLSGRAKKNFKTTDLILVALYCLLIRESPQGSNGLLLANDEDAADDLSLAKLLVNVNPELQNDLIIREKEILARMARACLCCFLGIRAIFAPIQSSPNLSPSCAPIRRFRLGLKVTSISTNNVLASRRTRRLHLNLPGAPEGSFLDQGAILNAVIRGRNQLSPKLNTAYHGYVDMSGGSGDDAALCITHAENGRAVVDLAVTPGGKPPFNPRAAVRMFAYILKSYGIRRVWGDAGNFDPGLGVGRRSRLFATQPCTHRRP
jgi:hypothetical protein